MLSEVKLFNAVKVLKENTAKSKKRFAEASGDDPHGWDKFAADHDRMGILSKLAKAGFRGKFKKGETSGEFNYRGVPVELSLGGENLYFKLPASIYSKDSHADMIDAVAKFLDVVQNYGGYVK